MKKGIVILLITLASCDYYTEQKVLVIDKTTNRPIENVNVSFGPYKLFTDKSGFCSISAGGTGNLLERTITVDRTGYTNFEITLKINDGDYVTYKQKRTSSSYIPKTSFAVLQDTLVVYLEKNKTQ